MKSINLGLIGWPVAHSVSPPLHRGALQSVGLEGEYCLYPVPPLPEGEAALDALLARLRAGTLRGLNVTIPHKLSAYHKVDVLTDTARVVGAVNTLYINEGDLWGGNTDVQGFTHDLRGLARNNGRVLVLGAGGAARAVVYGLALEGWSMIYIAARRLVQAEALVAALAPVIQRKEANGKITFPGGKPVKFVPMELASEALAGAAQGLDLVVNTTPVGMTPHLEVSPWPDQLPWPAGAAAYDLVYNPEETLFLRTAGAAGAPCRGGLGMLVEQAALAFERWTGINPSRDAMRAGLSGEGSLD
jgi:shikimate dehydrogenase